MKDRNAFPEIILVNGNIRTQDINRPFVEAVAISQGRIWAVGDDEEIRCLVNPDTKVVDLHGKLCLPGMMDSHFHYYDWALGRKQLALADVSSFEDLMERVSDAVGRAEPEEWILGQGWNESEWPEPRMPMRDDLDKVSPSNPVALWRCDLHLAIVNSMALQLAGIHENVPDPPHGRIGRDGSGRPNGILREFASDLIKDVVPVPGDDELLVLMKEGIPFLHSLGITGLEDMRLMGGREGAPAFRAWQSLRDAGELDLRCWVSIPGERLEEAISLGLRTGFGDDCLRVGHVKFFADGGMGARTAWMLEPFLDADCGMPLRSPAELERFLHQAERVGLAIAVHAIGDRTNRELITVFEGLRGRYNQKDELGLRLPSHRVEHVQMIRPEDVIRLGRLNVVACVQPHNLMLDMAMVDECVGERGRWTYSYRNLIDEGVPLIFSSDAPVCDPNPFVGIHAAVTRKRKDGTPARGWYPSQRISVGEAVRGYTILAARSYGVEEKMGSITPGKYADMVVLDRDIYTVDPEAIIETKVDITVFDGKVVFQRN